MTNARRTHEARESLGASRAWYATPLLVAVFAAGAMLLPRGMGLSEAVAAQPAFTGSVPSLQSVVVASPQPGEREPALDPLQMAQSY